MGAEKSLYDYLQILKSPEVYPDIASAGYFLGPLIAIASKIIAFAGIFAMIAILIRIGIDVLLVAGVGNLIKGDGTGNRGAFMGALTQLSSFKDEKDIPYNDPWGYMTSHGYKIILMLAFVGLMVSGMLLPLAGTFTASAGAAISKVANINPVPYIEALEIDVSGLEGTISRSSVSSLISGYNKQTGYMTSALQRSQNRDDLSDEEYAQVAAAYYNAYWASEIYSYEMEKAYKDLKAQSEEAGQALGKDGERLKNFNYNAHRVNVDTVLLKHGKEFSGGSGNSNPYAETDLEVKAKKLREEVASYRPSGKK